MSVDDVCFVIMPFDTKKDADGNVIDFNAVYEYVIKRAVALVPGLTCLRSDDIDKPGSIHSRMIRSIYDSRVAIVDTSTLNPNVFYELGVRHALRKAVTVLIRRRGTTSPFNIEGMSSLEYSTDLEGADKAKNDIRDAIVSALADPANVDSLVHEVLPGLHVHLGPARAARRLSKVETFEFPLVGYPDRCVGLVTGDREYVSVGDIWVNSENSNMQMDRLYGVSTSATIRYLGSRKNAAGNVVEDTIADELRAIMVEAGAVEVAPATVLATGPGELRQNNVKWVFHVASVRGEPREGYRPIANIERCVTNALREAGRDAYRSDAVSSMLFPILGTGPGGGKLEDHAERCIHAAAEYLESSPGSPISSVYFYCWSDIDLEVCQAVIRGHQGLRVGDQGG